MKKIVVDSSVIVKWAIPEDFSENAVKILRDMGLGVVSLYAPTLALSEVSNVLWKYVLKGFLTSDQAKKAIDLISSIDVSYVKENWRQLEDALAIALDESISVYDALYVVLAKELNAELVTADEKLYQYAKKRVNAFFISSYR